ncbi:spermidine/putrescine ABC transporter permease [Vibrio lentus]|jgi:putative spermidine/putrescine transport system permease protein|uniref:ABC transporter permease n=2 Tax=Vibrio TaxID=662 RepID=A0A1R3EGX2_9VIBR|nr:MULTISPECIES: ABC transporter permease [Vibrio]KPL94826.1 spermidine/putrescine ABC transporter permease [Vibrio splendidus]MCB5361339.1 ABC transporter permease [Vibrio lentus]MCB5451408.1 ABC transporter permease [Vibrio lentus]MCB5463074.1 ABC transporter permease [Vibrio lentus]MCC4784466.1 ABC transporter permease [Vibrio lentus]
MSRLRNLTNTQWVMLISISFFVLVNLLWLGVPFAMAIIWSLVDPNHPWSYPDLLPQVLSFGRWIEVWETTSLPEALRNSYSVAPAVAILTITLAMPTAYAFGRMEFRGKKLAEMVSLLPMVMPSMILAVFFSAMLLELGLTDPYVNIVIAHTVLALPYAIRILSAGFKAIPQDLIDACSDMGAGKIGTFKHAFLPMLKPSLLASSIFCLVISIEEFNMSYVLGAPDFITVPTILYSFLGYSFIRPDAAVVSLILVIPNVLLMLLIERLLKGNYLSQSTGKA